MNIVRIIESEIKQAVADKETRELGIKMLLSQDKSEMRKLIGSFLEGDEEA